MPSKLTASEYRKLARALYHDEDHIEVDDKAQVSKNSDGDDGAYVRAWVWVADSDAKNA